MHGRSSIRRYGENRDIKERWRGETDGSSMIVRNRPRHQRNATVEAASFLHISFLENEIYNAWRTMATVQNCSVLK